MSNPWDDMPEGRKHIFKFIFSVRSGAHPDEQTMAFIVDALMDIYDGKDPSNALKLQKGRGNRKDAHAGKYIGWALAVELARRDGIGLNSAIELVATETGKSFDTIKRRHDQNKDFVNGLLEANEYAYQCACAYLIVKELKQHNIFDEAVASVARKTGVPISTLKQWYQEHIAD